MPYRSTLVLLVALLALSACDGTTADNKSPNIQERPSISAYDKKSPEEGAKKAEPTDDSVDARRERALSALIVRLLQSEHLSKKTIDDDLSRIAYDRYLESLDPAKLFLLQADIDALDVHRDMMDDQLKSGKIDLAREGSERLQKRLAVVRKVVDGALAKPFDYTIDETAETDPEKRAWCKTEAELAERWRKVLKLSVLGRIARDEEADKLRAETEGAKKEPKAPKTEVEREVEGRKKLADQWSARFARLDQQEPLDRLEVFYNAVAGSFDPHSVYLPPARKENFDIEMSGSLEGIGAVLQEKEHYVAIVRIVPGSASWRQGDLEAGDIILSVAQADADAVDVVDMRLRDVVKLIRGKKGTVVTLTVRKSDESVEVIPITRDVVNIEASYAKAAILMQKGTKDKVGYIDLPSFYGNTRSRRGNTPQRSCTDDVRKILEGFGKRGVGQVVVDLRGNGGGLLNDARQMSGLFIEAGPIVQTRAVDGSQEILRDFDRSVTFKGRVVVLVDRFSASASEILAGALQDYERAVIVGAPQTHGKGTVQHLRSLDRLLTTGPGFDDLRPLGVLKLTSQQFYRISGGSTQNKGIVPDIILPDAASHVESGERFYDHAVPWNKVDKLEYKPWSGGRGDLNELRTNSEARQKGHPEFNKIQSRGSLLKARREQSIEPLKAETWKAKVEKEKAELKALTLDFEKAPARFDVEIFDYSGAEKARQEAEKNRPGAEGRKTGQAEPDAWKKRLASDPWVEESMFILRDMPAK